MDCKVCYHYECQTDRKEAYKCCFCFQPLGERFVDWCIVSSRSGGMTSHYCCRDADPHSSVVAIDCRRRAGYEPETCLHNFDGKTNTQVIESTQKINSSEKDSNKGLAV